MGLEEKKDGEKQASAINDDGSDNTFSESENKNYDSNETEEINYGESDLSLNGTTL